METNPGDNPGYQSQPNRNSPGEEVRGHWTPTDVEPMEQWMEWTLNITEFWQFRAIKSL